jgi:hypothetical protein
MASIILFITHSLWLHGYGALLRLKPFLFIGSPPTALHAPFMRPNAANVIQNFQKFFLNDTTGEVQGLMGGKFCKAKHSKTLVMLGVLSGVRPSPGAATFALAGVVK